MSYLRRILFLALAGLSLFLSEAGFAQGLCRDLYKGVTATATTQDDFYQTIEEHQSRIKFLPNLQESALAKLLAIRQAKSTIDMDYFIFDADKTGILFLRELKNALARGVKIRMLVDHYGTITNVAMVKDFLRDPHFAFLLKDAPAGALEIKSFNTPQKPSEAFVNLLSALVTKNPIKNFRWAFKDFMYSVNNRNHNKILLIDTGTPDAVAFTGSSNIGDDYSGFNVGHPPESNVDIMIRSTGITSETSLDAQIKKYFEIAYYNQATSSLTDELLSILPEDTTEVAAIYKDNHEALDSQLNIEQRLAELAQQDFLNADLVSADFKFVSEIQNILYRDSLFSAKWVRWGKSANTTSLWRTIKQRALTAKKIEIITPYLLLSKTDLRMIVKWLKQDPARELHLYTRGKSNTSSLVVDIFDGLVGPRIVELQKDPEIGNRLQVHVFNGSPDNLYSTLHAKIVTIDDDQTLIHTSNLDGRSRWLNSELGFWIHSSAINAQAKQWITLLKADSVPWGSPQWEHDNRPTPKSWRRAHIMALLSKMFSVDLFF